ncbi:hypothetical protein [Salinibacterium sp. ZJ450]|uniref:hypothetical protein n=1 Tax=Salinibacterium sp. ZJ450 TaxID=2708338 RepID=UPI00141DFAFA|nr:hypothetical protein [Salinibacterium sp. ZJ450]
MAMQHSRQDAIDARARASKSPTPNWHPILAAVEIRPGLWHMVDQYNQPYAVVLFLELGGEQGYRAVHVSRDGHRNLVGYYRTLRAACEAAHGVYVRAHGPAGFAPDPWSPAEPPPRH